MLLKAERVICNLTLERRTKSVIVDVVIEVSLSISKAKSSPERDVNIYVIIIELLDSI
jgi:hypothetical protein